MIPIPSKTNMALMHYFFGEAKVIATLLVVDDAYQIA
jgi:hypothetical protein